jgi:hypothetical protein
MNRIGYQGQISEIIHKADQINSALKLESNQNENAMRDGEHSSRGWL